MIFYTIGVSKTKQTSLRFKQFSNMDMSVTNMLTSTSALHMADTNISVNI